MNFAKLNVFRFLLLVFLLFITRILFVWWNNDSYLSYPVSDLIIPILLGLRFDIAAACIFMAPILLIDFLFHRFTKGVIVSSFFYTAIVLFALSINISDMEFFRFTGKKMTTSIFSLLGAFGTHGTQVIGDNIVLVLVYFFIAFFFIFCVKKYLMKEYKLLSIKKSLWIFIFLLALNFVGIRGGLQPRTITAKNAFVFNDFLLGNIALNSSYSLMRSLTEKRMKPIKYFSDDAYVLNYLKEQDPRVVPANKYPKQNIVIIMIESFTSEYMGAINGGSLTPFLDRLSKKSLFFPLNFANGVRSMHAQPSIFASLPSLLEKTIYKGPYQANKFHALPEILKKEGYTNYYFHGSDRGIFGFDAYALSIGFDRYFSKEDYDGPQKDFDGNWGIYDRPYLIYAAKEISKMKEPFLANIFTLSSHHPFNLEPEFKGKLPSGPSPVQELIAYVDLSLKNFFKQVEKKDWYQNTLFVITGDHSFSAQVDPGYQHFIGKFRVPLLFFHPRINLKKEFDDPLRITQHADIMPTIFDFLGINPSWRQYMGTSLLRPNEGKAINYFSGYHYLVKNGSVVLFNGESEEYFTVSGDLKKMNKAPANPELLKELKIYLQYYLNGLIKNNLYIK